MVIEFRYETRHLIGYNLLFSRLTFTSNLMNENDRPVVEDSGGKIENEQDDSETLTGPLLRQPWLPSDQ